MILLGILSLFARLLIPVFHYAPDENSPDMKRLNNETETAFDHSCHDLLSKKKKGKKVFLIYLPDMFLYVLCCYLFGPGEGSPIGCWQCPCLYLHEPRQKLYDNIKPSWFLSEYQDEKILNIYPDHTAPNDRDDWSPPQLSWIYSITANLQQSNGLISGLV